MLSLHIERIELKTNIVYAWLVDIDLREMITWHGEMFAFALLFLLLL